MKNTIAILCLLSTSILFGQTKGKTEKSTNKPFVLGQIEEFHSKIMNENRVLNVYLPNDYNANDSNEYPVIYLLDGSADEDFVHIAGLVQFASFEWINQVEKSIVVGIANVDRRRDFSFPSTIESDLKFNPTSGHSATFISFIEQEVQPLIEKKYKTTTSKTLIGQSLGGLLATEILLKKPTLFNTYIIVSPSLWWNNGSILSEDSEVYKDSFTQPTTVYIGVGKEGLTPTEIPRVMEVDANVLADQIAHSKSQAISLFFDYLPKENHATILHQAVMNAFRMISER